MLIGDQRIFEIVKVMTDAERILFTETWYSIWVEEQYTCDGENLREKYARYDPFSCDYLLMKKNHAIGTMRIIHQNEKTGLPVLNDFTTNNNFTRSSPICEATLLTVQKMHRRSQPLAIFELLMALWKHVRFHNIEGIVIAADVRLWYLLTRNLGLSFHEMGIRKLYEGSITVPAYLSVMEQKKVSLSKPAETTFEKILQDI